MMAPHGNTDRDHPLFGVSDRREQNGRVGRKLHQHSDRFPPRPGHPARDFGIANAAEAQGGDSDPVVRVPRDRLELNI